MAEFELAPVPALDGYEADFGGTSLREATGLALVAVATPRGGADRLAAALKDEWGAEMPAPGWSTLDADGETRFIWTAPDQMFVAFEHAGPRADAGVAERLGATSYVTDQSDNWTGLHLSGPKSRAALERLSMLDLGPDAFLKDQAVRTVMEHVGVLIVRDGADAFLLLSARSSARSFLRAVEVSLRHVT